MFIEPNPEIIKRNFSKISGSYDRANDAMTLGLLRLWRKKLVEWSGVREGDRVLDVATGTGDLAFLFKKKTGEYGQVVGLDLTPDMIEVGRKKAEKRHIEIDWCVGDAMDMKFKDNLFDISAVGFGIRNMKSPQLALRQMARVTKPGGRVLVLETGCPQNPLWRKVYGTYFKTVLPQIGGIVSGHWGPYRFLQRSSMAFPSGLGFLNWMRETGQYSDLEFQVLFGGVAYLYMGRVRKS